MAHQEARFFLLQSLGFVINQGKSLMIPIQEIEFLEMIINWKDMTISLPPEMLCIIKLMCQDLSINLQIKIVELRKVPGYLAQQYQQFCK